MTNRATVPEESEIDESYWERKRIEAHCDPRTNDELIRSAIALDDVEDDSDGRSHPRNDILELLQYRMDVELFETGRDLCRSDNPAERRLGVDILSQNMAHPKTMHDEIVPVLLSMLETEAEDCVLTCIGFAAGHLGDPRTIDPVSRLRNHANASVRRAVVHAMLTHEHPAAIRTLIELSADEDDYCRDWATFGLGSQIETNTADIRDALYRRIDDTHDETRGEAMLGLAKRKDTRVVEPLLRELAANSVSSLEIEAAGEVGDPRYLPHLTRRLGGDAWWVNSLLEEAIERCRPQSMTGVDHA
jgi:HEAT repeat protein